MGKVCLQRWSLQRNLVGSETLRILKASQVFATDPQLQISPCLHSGTSRTQPQPYIFPPKNFIRCRIKTALDGTSDEESLCFLCVPLFRRGIWCGFRGHPKIENWALRGELKNACGRVWDPTLGRPLFMNVMTLFAQG